MDQKELAELQIAECRADGRMNALKQNYSKETVGQAVAAEDELAQATEAAEIYRALRERLIAFSAREAPILIAAALHLLTTAEDAHQS